MQSQSVQKSCKSMELQSAASAARKSVMELDAASLAIGRIERALSRLERANVGQTPEKVAVQQGDLLAPPAAQPADDALRNEVKAVIAELDQLIAGASRG